MGSVANNGQDTFFAQQGREHRVIPDAKAVVPLGNDGSNYIELKVNSIGQLEVVSSGTPSLPADAATLTEQQLQTASLELIDDCIHASDSALNKVAAIGAQFDDASPGITTENNIRPLRMSTRREMYIQIRDAAGNERGANVTAGGAVNVVLASGTTTNVEVIGDVASDVAVTANPVTVGGRASTSTPTAVNADGDAVNLWLDRSGGVVVNGRDAHDAAPDANSRPVQVGGVGTAAAPTNVTEGDAVRAWHLLNGAQATALTAAGALIGGDSANGLDVDITRAPSDKTEDSAHSSGATGAFVLAVRNDLAGSVQGALAALAGSDLDYSAFAANQYGCLRIETMPSLNQAFYSGITKTISTAFVNATASGNTSVVSAPSSGNKIVVLETFLVNQGTTVIAVKFQSGTTDKTPTIDLSADGGGGRAFLQFECADAEALNVNLSEVGTEAVGVMVRYITAAV